VTRYYDRTATRHYGRTVTRCYDRTLTRYYGRTVTRYYDRTVTHCYDRTVTRYYDRTATRALRLRAEQLGVQPSAWSTENCAVDCLVVCLSGDSDVPWDCTPSPRGQGCQGPPEPSWLQPRRPLAPVAPLVPHVAQPRYAEGLPGAPTRQTFWTDTALYSRPAAYEALALSVQGTTGKGRCAIKRQPPPPARARMISALRERHCSAALRRCSRRSIGLPGPRLHAPRGPPTSTLDSVRVYFWLTLTRRMVAGQCKRVQEVAVLPRFR
jgi:hypothetical protein